MMDNKITFKFNNSILRINVTFCLKTEYSSFCKKIFNSIFINSQIFENKFLENYYNFLDFYDTKNNVISENIVIITIFSDNLDFITNITNIINNYYALIKKDEKFINKIDESSWKNKFFTL